MRMGKKARRGKGAEDGVSVAQSNGAEKEQGLTVNSRAFRGASTWRNENRPSVPLELQQAGSISSAILDDHECAKTYSIRGSNCTAAVPRPVAPCRIRSLATVGRLL
jgi:hypothetical protein